MSFSYRILEERYLKQFRKWFPRLVFSHEFSPGKFVMPERYLEIAQNVIDFKVRPDDVWVLSFPRTGSTWCQEIVWLLANNLDFDTARTVRQLTRASIIEYPVLDPALPEIGDISLRYVDNMPRCIRSHIPYGLLPNEVKTVKPKVVYIMRNPKDVYCSYYSFFKTCYDIQASFEEAGKFFCEGKLPFGDYLDHCLTFWEKRNESNIFVLKYEDMLSNTKKTIKDIAIFLEKPITDEQIDKVYEHVLFDNMKCNPAVNFELDIQGRKEDTKAIIREGKVGDWKNRMTPEMSNMFDKWIETHSKQSDLTFIYE